MTEILPILGLCLNDLDKEMTPDNCGFLDHEEISGIPRLIGNETKNGESYDKGWSRGAQGLDPRTKLVDRKGQLQFSDRWQPVEFFADSLPNDPSLNNSLIVIR